MHRALLLLASLASAAAVSIEWYANETTWPSCSVPVSLAKENREDHGRVVAFQGSQGETLTATPLYYGDAVTSVRLVDDEEEEQNSVVSVFYLSGFANCPEDDALDVVVNVVDAASPEEAVAGPFATSIGPNPTAEAVINTFTLEYSSGGGEVGCYPSKSALSMSLAADGKLTYSYTYTECTLSDSGEKSEKKTLSDELSADDVGDDAPWKADGKERALASLASVLGASGTENVCDCPHSTVTFSATWTDAAFPATLASEEEYCGCHTAKETHIASPRHVLLPFADDIKSWLRSDAATVFLSPILLAVFLLSILFT